MFNKIAKYRKKSGLTQVALATELKIAQSTLSSWESGKTTPSIDMINKMAKIFDICGPELFERGKVYTDERHISEFDNEELMEILKDTDELMDVFRYMSEYDRAKLINMAKAVFPEAFEAAKTKKNHYNPYQLYAERNHELWPSERTPEPPKEPEPSDSAKTDDGKPDTP